MVLNVFQLMTVGVIIALIMRFKSFENLSSWKVNRLILIISGLLTVGMLVYERYHYECMSQGVYGVPLGLQIVSLLLILYFYFQKKE